MISPLWVTYINICGKSIPGKEHMKYKGFKTRTCLLCSRSWVNGMEQKSRSIVADGVRDLTGCQIIQSLLGHCKDFITLRCIVIGGFKFFDYFEILSSLWKSCKKYSENSWKNNSPVVNTGHICFIILFLCLCMYVNVTELLRVIIDTMSLNSKMRQLFFYKNKNIFLCNHTMVIKFRKFNIVTILYSKFHHCPIVSVMINFFYSLSRI